MASIQIDSFVEKFKLLQGAGYKASLSFESELGEVSISLSFKVGINTPPSSPLQTFLGRRSPSYYRRLERRNAERSSFNEFPSNSTMMTEVKANTLRQAAEEDACNEEDNQSFSNSAELAVDDVSTKIEERSTEEVAVSQCTSFCHPPLPLNVKFIYLCIPWHWFFLRGEQPPIPLR